jgi:tRNA threonylcarbamoyladenosine biosynthesis protein TsaB
MNILGLDTATPSTAVGLLGADGTLLEARDDVAPGERGRHAERLLALSGSLLGEAALGWADIDVIAVGVGPGGYTGLRIGLATAHGLALAHGARLVGVGTLRALAAPLADVTALAIIDARRAELFVAAYAADEELLAPTLLTPSRLASLGEIATGPPLLAVGDGALAHREALESSGIAVADESSDAHRVRGGAICRLAGADIAAGAGGGAVPLYLRLPDAELALRAAGR